ncbi:MAG: EamA family transporter [Planctomycetota bacterium]
MIAFAANSVLCRLALGGEPEPAIDAWSFTAVRLGSGALTLLALVAARRLPRTDNGSWKGAGFLTLYALPFSFAYLALDTGTGALLLFGAVQLTMIGLGLRYLVSPGVTAPDPLGAGVMALAGIGWGLYSVAGKSPGNPTVVTAGNFARAAVVIVPLSAAAIPWMAWSAEGIALAAASGALASGCGYAVWYAALKYLPATRAALVQLSVPPIAAAGGVWLGGEGITQRLAVSSVVILGSIGLGVAGRAKSH